MANMTSDPGSKSNLYFDCLSSSNLVISAAIMAGFLPFADTEEQRGEINSQLETMFRSVMVMVILYTTNNGRMID